MHQKLEQRVHNLKKKNYKKTRSSNLCREVCFRNVKKVCDIPPFILLQSTRAECTNITQLETMGSSLHWEIFPFTRVSILLLLSPVT